MSILTCVGSRSTPENILAEMRALGQWARERGHWIRSGHASGADYAFEQGARDHCLVYLPWPKFNSSLAMLGTCSGHYPRLEPQERDLLQEICPWVLGRQGPERLHTRNFYQVMGLELNRPSEVLICWTPCGRDTGGTRTAIMYARKNGIPVVNMFHHPTLDRVMRQIELQKKIVFL